MDREATIAIFLNVKYHVEIVDLNLYAIDTCLTSPSSFVVVSLLGLKKSASNIANSPENISSG